MECKKSTTSPVSINCKNKPSVILSIILAETIGSRIDIIASIILTTT